MNGDLAHLEHDGNEHIPLVVAIGSDPLHCDLCAGTWTRRHYARLGLELTNRQALEQWELDHPGRPPGEREA